MMNTNNVNTQNNTLGHAKRAFKSLVVAFVAVTTLSLATEPKTAQAFNLDELVTLVEDLAVDTTEVVVADSTTDAAAENEDITFREQMQNQTDTMKDVSAVISGKSEEIKSVAEGINSESEEYVEGVEVEESGSLDDVVGFFEGMSPETIENAVTSIKNGEEITSEYELINTGLQIAGLQNPENVVMEAVVMIARSFLGLLLVASLIGLAKHQINKGYRN